MADYAPTDGELLRDAMTDPDFEYILDEAVTRFKDMLENDDGLDDLITDLVSNYWALETDEDEMSTEHVERGELLIRSTIYDMLRLKRIPKALIQMAYQASQEAYKSAHPSES